MLLKLINKIKNYVYVNKIKKMLNSDTLRVNGRGIVLHNPSNIIIGDSCGINNNVFLHGGGESGGGIEIGNNVTISAFTQIYSYQLETKNWKNIYLEKKHIGKKVFINDGAWIGAGTIIVPGVQITGKGVIVAAGSVVTDNIDEDFVLVAGNPACIVKYY